MQRTLLNLIIDLAAALLFLGMCATGYIMWFPLPPGTNKAYTLWALTRHEWGHVHFWISMGLLAVLLLHLGLHWKWLVTVIRQRLHLPAARGSLWTSGLATFLAVAVGFGLFAWAAGTGIRRIEEPHTDTCPPQPAPGETATLPPNSSPRELVRVTWDQVYPILEKACLSCHGPSRQRGDFRVDRLADYFDAESREPLVIPGDAAASPLVAIVSGMRDDLPVPQRHVLPGRDVDLIRAWIDAGATVPKVKPQ